MLEEHAFSNGIRGKYAAKHEGRTRLIKLGPGLAEYFPDSASANGALIIGQAREETQK